jgi:hypothetical protein
MSETVQILRTSNLGITCYPTTPDELFQLMAERLIGVFTSAGFGGIIISDTAPGASDRGKAWLSTVDGNIYRWWTEAGFTGWGRQHPVANDSGRRIWWAAAEADLITEDGGSAGAVGAATGPFWERDTAYDGKFALQSGTLQPSGDAVAVGATGGVDEHTLTEAEGGVGSHVHKFGLSNAGNDDAYFRNVGVATVPSFSGYYITGSNGNIVTPLTTADLETLPSGTDGAGKPTPDAFKILPNYRSGLWAKRTARIYQLPP